MVENRPSLPLLLKAFDLAIGRFAEWRPAGEPEPVVRVESQDVSISSLCNHLRRFDGDMPQSLWDQLASVSPGWSEVSIDRSYRSAASYLAELIEEKRSR